MTVEKCSGGLEKWQFGAVTEAKMWLDYELTHSHNIMEWTENMAEKIMTKINNTDYWELECLRKTCHPLYRIPISHSTFLWSTAFIVRFWLSTSILTNPTLLLKWKKPLDLASPQISCLFVFESLVVSAAASPSQFWVLSIKEWRRAGIWFTSKWKCVLWNVDVVYYYSMTYAHLPIVSACPQNMYTGKRNGLSCVGNVFISWHFYILRTMRV